MSIDRDKLYPGNTSGKHPYAQDIIKMAEAQGIGVSKIADLLEKSQPYISQIKAGKGSLSVEDLEPLIRCLDPRAPGDEFYAYEMVTYVAALPENWEREILVKGFASAWAESDPSYYDRPNFAFPHIERVHQKALDSMAAKPFHGVKKRQEHLKNLLQHYTASSQQESCLLEKVQGILKATVSSAPSYLAAIQDSQALSDALGSLIRPELERALRGVNQKSKHAVYGAQLLNSCKEYMESLAEFDESLNVNPLDIGNGEQPEESALEEYAQWVIANYESRLKIYPEKVSENRKQHPLTENYSGQAVEEFLAEEVDCSDKEILKKWGQQIFGDTLVKMGVLSEYNDEIKFYEVSMKKAFVEWIDSYRGELKIQREVKREPIQICGHKLFEWEDDTKIVVHELHSHRFIVLHLEDTTAASEMSDPLSVEELLNYVKELPEDGLSELQEVLIRRGYRVPGVRTIY